MPRLNKTTPDYWRVIAAQWDGIDIYEGPKVFASTFNKVSDGSGLLYASHFAQSEICNGGFHQFFWNSTGVLAPEAIKGFKAIGMPQIAAIVEQACSEVGNPYPRDRAERHKRLADIGKQGFDELDKRFFVLIESEAGGFERASDSYAQRLSAARTEVSRSRHRRGERTK